VALARNRSMVGLLAGQLLLLTVQKADWAGLPAPSMFHAQVLAVG